MAVRRSFPEITNLRQRTAYVNFPSPLTPRCTPAASSAVLTEVRFDRKVWETIEDGFGSRHLCDSAPFALWDKEKQDFRYPTPTEKNWIVSRYRSTAISVRWPVIFIETAEPPSPLPLTVGCVAAVFVPAAGDANPIETVSPLYATACIELTTNYASPRVTDPVSSFRLKAWTFPTRQQREHIIKALHTLVSVKRINFFWPYIIAELYVDGRVYRKHTLPGKVAGCTTFYHHKEASYWHDMNPRTRERLIDPGSGAQDSTNYLENGNRELSPGVRLESAPVTDEGPYATSSWTTTAGVMLRNIDGQVRMTVSNHGFPKSDEVFHPSTDGCRIGEITERWLPQDIAFVHLDPSVAFSNNSYFEAQTPKRLLRSQQLENSCYGSWFCADGMSTGLVFLFIQGVSSYEARRPTNPRPIEIEIAEWRTENIYHMIGPTGGTTKDGLCGAPIVQDDSVDGGVAGFFQLANNEICLSPVLDEIIDRGWSLQ